MQSCSTIFLDHDDDLGSRVLTPDQETWKLPTPPPLPASREIFRPEKTGTKTNYCLDPPSIICPLDEMEAEVLRRTRAKTPCFWVGQLEQCARDNGCDFSTTLAAEYQALLPPRIFTPTPKSLLFGKTVRKIKGQQSLRDLVEAEEQQPRFSIQSDCDTLVGSESPPSPLTPTSGHFNHEKSEFTDFEFGFKKPSISRGASEMERMSNLQLTQGNDVGFQLCLDLLTEQLASGLFKKHPTEELNRASSLQILLMIEAYESVQQQLLLEKSNGQDARSQSNHVGEIEQTLDHWLRALYSIYERMGLNDSVESFRSCKTSISNSSSIISEPPNAESRDGKVEVAQQLEKKCLETDVQEQLKLRRKLKKVQKREGSWWIRPLGN
jgi:hypothetical protein